MKLGIVGHAAEKFTATTERIARDAIREAIMRHKPEAVVSGHSPMGGVDLWVEEIAAELFVPTMIFPPTVNQWRGPGGFKARNLKIAHESDVVLVVVVKDLPPNFHGMKFDQCYHCRGSNPPHIKSGGCWTAWKAKKREWVIINAVGPEDFA